VFSIAHTKTDLAAKLTNFFRNEFLFCVIKESKKCLNYHFKFPYLTKKLCRFCHKKAIFGAKTSKGRIKTALASKVTDLF
jgi:hypothetical protein